MPTYSSFEVINSVLQIAPKTNQNKLSLSINYNCSAGFLHPGV